MSLRLRVAHENSLVKSNTIFLAPILLICFFLTGCPKKKVIPPVSTGNKTQTNFSPVTPAEDQMPTLAPSPHVGAADPESRAQAPADHDVPPASSSAENPAQTATPPPQWKGENVPPAPRLPAPNFNQPAPTEQSGTLTHAAPNSNVPPGITIPKISAQPSQPEPFPPSPPSGASPPGTPGSK
jgi:hypothetical protein